MRRSPLSYALSAPQPPPSRKYLLRLLRICIFGSRAAGIAQLVERNLAKVDVAGSNPVSRSVPWQRDRERRQSRPSFRYTSSCEVPRRPQSHQAAGLFLRRLPRRRSQVAKAEVCKTSIHRFDSDRRLTKNAHERPSPMGVLLYGPPGTGLHSTICLGTLRPCRGGGIGRRKGLKILWTARSVRVQVPPPVQPAPVHPAPIQPGSGTPFFHCVSARPFVYC